MESILTTAFSWTAFTLATYYVLQFAFYWYHRFLHLPAAGALYRLHHIGHHKVCVMFP
jgi:hypothetical protein